MPRLVRPGWQFVKGQGMDSQYSPVVGYLHNAEQLSFIGGIFIGTFKLLVVVFVAMVVFAIINRRLDP